MTSFTRIVIVLSLLRQALGVPQVPPNQVLIGLALLLTVFIMRPVGERLHTQVVQPYLAQSLSTPAALQQAMEPLRDFMLRQTREKDLALFIQVAHASRPSTPADVPLTALLPAFIISELRTAFQIGFLLYLPFLILDLVISSLLVSMGMMMLPQALISLPFKLMLFVLVDGWNLIIGSLVRSFQ
jgi:flagellar biosynthetic protein FliP